jgi:hypothetical protein
LSKNPVGTGSSSIGNNAHDGLGSNNPAHGVNTAGLSDNLALGGNKFGGNNGVALNSGLFTDNANPTELINYFNRQIKAAESCILRVVRLGSQMEIKEMVIKIMHAQHECFANSLAQFKNCPFF